MHTVDIRNEPRFMDQYIELRNLHAEVLMTEPVSGTETREWLRTAAVEVIGLADQEVLEGVAILYLERKGEVAFFARKPGQGTGSELLKAVEATARSRGLQTLWSWVRKENAIAQRAFQKNGFIPHGEETRRYRGLNHQGVVYRKRIA